MSTFVIVFIAVPSYLTFLGDSGNVIAGLVLAVAAAILSMKYKYLTVIITTAFSGSFMLFGIIEGETGLSHAIITVLAVIFALIGLAVQCFVEREELKETYEHIKEKRSQISSAPKKIKEKIDSKKSDPKAEAEKEEQ